MYGRNILSVVFLLVTFWDDEDDSPPAIVRVPEFYPSDSVTEGEGKSVDKEKSVHFGKQQNIKAIPILPPRAVLSSPVNDGKIENISRNKSKPDLMSGLKDHNLCERHIRCKVVSDHTTREPWCHHTEPSCYHRHTTTPVATANTARRRVPKEASAGKQTLNEKNGSATSSPRLKSKTQKKRPEFICI